MYVTDGENSRIQVFAPDVNRSLEGDNNKGNGDIPTSDTTGNTTSKAENPTAPTTGNTTSKAENQAPSQPAGISDQV